MKKKLLCALFATTLATGYFLGSAQPNPTTQARNNNFKSEKVEVYKTESKNDLKKLTNLLSKRKGKIIVEIVTGKVVNNNGDGKDSCGYYIAYDKKKFKKGDKVQTVFVYNPENNYTDDILYRVDTLIK